MHLGQKILSLSPLVSSSADTSSPPGASLLLTVGMSHTCHGCHAPLDDDHKDYPSGWQKCPLDHWTGCKGGIVEGKAGNGSEWRGCSLEYVYVEAVSDDEDLDEDPQQWIQLSDENEIFKALLKKNAEKKLLVLDNVIALNSCDK